VCRAVRRDVAARGYPTRHRGNGDRPLAPGRRPAPNRPPRRDRRDEGRFLHHGPGRGLMSFATGVQNPTKAPSAGFADPVRDAQGCFRAIMNALARPGTLQRIDPGALEPPAPLTPTAAAVALTLFDYDTPIWLDPSLARSAAVAAFLRFHTGAPIVADALEAAFALVADPL